MGLSKESKVRVLESFYSIDNIIFGKSVTDIEARKDLKEDYILTKGALLQIFIEMLDLIDHSPMKMTDTKNLKDIREMAMASAIVAKDTAKKIIATEEGQQAIRDEVVCHIQCLDEGVKYDVEKIVQEKIESRNFSMAIDDVLIRRSINECKHPKVMNTDKGLLMEDAYKHLRTALVETAICILKEQKRK